jgi:hypothetical protein
MKVIFQDRRTRNQRKRQCPLPPPQPSPRNLLPIQHAKNSALTIRGGWQSMLGVWLSRVRVGDGFAFGAKRRVGRREYGRVGRCLLAVIALSVLSSAVGQAAEVGLSRQAIAGAHPPVAVAAVIISGQIVEGDAKKVAALLDDAKRTDDGHQILRLLINSSGGLVGEAMEIGKLVRKNGVEVFIPQNTSCISACILILAGGVIRTINGQVGIDHPHFLKAAGPGDDVPKLLADTKKITRDYFKSMGVAEDLADVMFSLPDGDVRFLRNDELLNYLLH